MVCGGKESSNATAVVVRSYKYILLGRRKKKNIRIENKTTRILHTDAVQDEKKSFTTRGSTTTKESAEKEIIRRNGEYEMKTFVSAPTNLFSSN